jgi:ParB-like chromosome segregation protein Spo0J
VKTPINKLKHFHKNPRKGDVQAVAESLEKLGQFKPIIVNRGTITGRRNEVLAGNHTLKAARQLGWADIDADFVDVDDDTAAKIVLADNRTADKATYDNAELLGLIQELPDTDGTGYTGDDIQDLLIEAELAAPALPTNTPDTDTAPAEPEDKWAAASRRSLIIDYPIPIFQWMQEKLYDLAKSKGTKSNAATVKQLLEEATQ